MQEKFCEESAVSENSVSEAKIYTVIHVISLAFLVGALVQAFFSIGYIGNLRTLLGEGKITQTGMVISLVEWFAITLGLAGIFTALFFLKRRFNVSYDYTFVEDELRVSKVFNGKKRKPIKRFAMDRITKIGWVKNPSYERTVAGFRKKEIVRLTPNKEPCEGKEFYYILHSTSYEKKVYVLEARQEMLEYLVRAAGVNKLERN